MINATREYVEGIISALNESGKVTFKEGENWVTDVKNKVVEYVVQDLLEMDYVEAKGHILHELGHVLYTDPLPPTELQEKFPTAMSLVYNTFEDIRIDVLLRQEYGDFYREVKEAGDLMASFQFNENVNKGKFLKDPLMQALAGVTMYHYGMNNDKQLTPRVDDWVTRGGSIIYDNSSTSARVAISEIINNNRTRKIQMFAVGSTADDLRKYVDREFYPILKDMITPDDPTGEQGKANKSHEGNGEKPEDNGREDTSVGKGSGVEFGGVIPSDKELDTILRPYVHTLTSRMDAILKERIATRFTGSYRSGKLLDKNAYKVMIPDTDRIFSRKRKVNKPHYVFTLILDESGSMTESSKHRDAYMGAYLIESVCKRMGFKVNVIGFTETPKDLKTVSSYRTIRSQGNGEIEALEYARQGKIDVNDDNIILMMTDGQVQDNPTELIKEYEKEGILTIGIGIGEQASNSVPLYYPHSITVPKTENLPKEMVTLLRTLIHR